MSSSKTNEDKSINIGSNKVDKFVFGARASVSLVPFVGGALAEIVGQLIPGQRVDRIQKYAELLNERIEALPKEIIEELLKNDKLISLIEDSFYSASRATSEERREYIVSIAGSGLTNDEVKINDAKYLLNLLNELNDSEVIWLRYYHERTIGGKQKYAQLHPNILLKEVVTLGANIDVRRKGALQDSYTEHLERLGLIVHSLDMQKVVSNKTNPRGITAPDVNVASYDNFGKRRISSTQTTVLGDMLLAYIGLIPE
jgi:hypothetical protein